MAVVRTLLARLAAWSAALYGVSIVLLTLVAGAATPGYSHVAQFISELGARGALYENQVRFAGFLPAGVFLLAYCFAAWRVLPRAGATSAALAGLAMYAAGYLAAAAWPCDLGCRPEEPSLSQVLHNAIGLLGYLAAPAFLCVLGHQARAWPGARLLVVLGYAGGAVALAGVLSLTPESPYAGLSQRAVEAAVLAWVLASAAAMRAPPAAAGAN